MISLEDVRRAAERIAPYIRPTPLMRARCTKDTPLAEGDLLLKLECLQVTGSFKARGATNKLLSLPREEVRRGIVTASGGTHGLATAYAGWLGKVRATVFVPENVSPEKARKLEAWGARVVVRGRHWHEANREALARADRDGLAYFHPFADPVIIAGQGTTALEILVPAEVPARQGQALARRRVRRRRVVDLQAGVGRDPRGLRGAGRRIGAWGAM